MTVLEISTLLAAAARCVSLRAACQPGAVTLRYSEQRLTSAVVSSPQGKNYYIILTTVASPVGHTRSGNDIRCFRDREGFQPLPPFHFFFWISVFLFVCFLSKRALGCRFVFKFVRFYTANQVLLCFFPPWPSLQHNQFILLLWNAALLCWKKPHWWGITN